MHEHTEILELAAAEIDFELEPAERAKLDAALQTCSLCRRQVAAVRATATVLRRPLEIGTPDRVRAVVIGAALRRGRRATGKWSMAAAALSILVVLGGAVYVGSRGLGILPVASAPPSSSARTAAPQASAVPTPSSAPSPASALPAPAVTEAPDPDAPIQVGDVVAMVTDGRLVIRTLPETGPNSALFKTKLYPGQRALVLEGPVDADGYPWYRIRVGDIEGWASAADLDGTPWLARVDNGLIAFVVDSSDGYSESIHTIGSDGTPADTPLFADPAISHYEQLTWSPDGRRLAFVGILAGAIDNRSEIFVIDADGSSLVQLTDDDLYDDAPTWAPDGSRLAFRQAAIDPLYASLLNSEIVVATTDGSAFEVLGPGQDPGWSPDSQLLAMTVLDNDATGIWVQASTGGDRRQVSDAASQETSVAWSPDELRLAIASTGLSVVDLGTGAITNLSGFPAGGPAWSPRGTIAFTSGAGSEPPGIFVIEPDGHGLTEVAAIGMRPVLAWSPDGRHLLLDQASTGDFGVLDPTRAVVPPPLASGRSPAWQPSFP